MLYSNSNFDQSSSNHHYHMTTLWHIFHTPDKNILNVSQIYSNSCWPMLGKTLECENCFSTILVRDWKRLSVNVNAAAE